MNDEAPLEADAAAYVCFCGKNHGPDPGNDRDRAWNAVVDHRRDTVDLFTSLLTGARQQDEAAVRREVADRLHAFTYDATDGTYAVCQGCGSPEHEAHDETCILAAVAAALSSQGTEGEQ